MRLAGHATREAPISIFSTALKTTKATLTLLAISFSTIVLTIVLCILAVGKFLAPTESFRNWMRKVLAGLAEFWISVNNTIFSLYRNTHWDIQIPEGLDYNGCYLVSSNHQSWVDILVLQRSFNRKLPFFRFFIKSQLFWVPFLGIAWWALDMPFMKRHSREKIAKQPGLKGRDLENARKACEKFRTIPVAMTNFPEGTRFSTTKSAQRKSPYRNLLQPRIGGIGQVFYALAEELDALIDVTIVYPQSRQTGRGPTFWELLRGDISEIIVRAEKRDIPKHLLGRNFRTDHEFRGELETWMSQLWLEKDQLISTVLDQKHRVR
ncbi:MAG: acyltransferase [Xanthomonadales bacterium]|nr:acyltransferase [Xanthomonadales bacterium]MDH3940625.1 acyltransferase [Xanthomonadales bacterium]MDH3999827.1 acyltransferase [Xanthomonadales bacterium]